MTKIELETLELHKAACRKFLNGGKPDWEQRRYEIATAITAARADDIVGCHCEIGVEGRIEEILKVTDELIKQLKQPKDK